MTSIVFEMNFKEHGDWWHSRFCDSFPVYLKGEWSEYNWRLQNIFPDIWNIKQNEMRRLICA